MDEYRYTEESLRTISDDAKRRGDEEAAKLAHALLWTMEYCDRARDAAVSLAREARRVFPLLAITADGDGSIVEKATEPLRAIIAELLDGKVVDPTFEQREDGIVVEKSHWGMRAIAESLARTVEGAPNFMQGILKLKDNEEYVVTVQRPGGMSPADLVRERAAERDSARALAAKALQALEAVPEESLACENLATACDDERDPLPRAEWCANCLAWERVNAVMEDKDAAAALAEVRAHEALEAAVTEMNKAGNMEGIGPPLADEVEWYRLKVSVGNAVLDSLENLQRARKERP